MTRNAYPSFATIRYPEILAFIFVVGLSVWVLLAFHDQFWWAPDDGAYAHLAERILAGEVLHRDVQDLHAGYVNFANAGAMAVFGPKLVGLRYPLLLLTLIQTGLVYFLLLPRGTLVAVAAGAGMTSLSFVQFLNPTAHWYALFLFVAVAGVLVFLPKGARGRLAIVGFLVVTLFLFRQLSGVLAGIGVLTYLLCEGPCTRPAKGPSREFLLARSVLAVMGLGLLWYVLAKSDPATFVLFGLGPLGMIVWAMAHGGQPNREVASTFLRLAGGAVLALVPLVVYHLVNGSIFAWIDDAVFAAFALTELPFFDLAHYSDLILFGVSMVVGPADMSTFVNGFYWLALLLLAPAVAYWTLARLWRQGREEGARPVVLPFLGSFYALVAVHYQTPIYLTFTVAVSLAGLLWIGGEGSRTARNASAGLAFFLAGIGLYFHAGQTLERGLIGIMTGVRSPVFAIPGIDRAGLRVGAGDRALYKEIIGMIERETQPDSAILALPVNPELYFLSGRRNPTRFFNSAVGVRSDEDLSAVLDVLRRDPPALVFYRPDDKYNTPYGRRIMDFVRIRYEALPTRGGFEIYRYPVH